MIDKTDKPQDADYTSRTIMPNPPSSSELLLANSEHLQRLLRQEAGWLLRYEALEDLVQSVQCQVLETGSYEHRSEAEFVGWLRKVARNHLADRRDHWGARKRRAAGVLRITNAGNPSTGAISPADHDTPGPMTTAEQRELLVLAARALDTLPERDRQLLTRSAEGTELNELAADLGLSYAAVQRSLLRAKDRLQRAVRALRG